MKGLLLFLLVIHSLSQSSGLFQANQMCMCDQLITQNDCIVMGQMCYWNGSSCNTSMCSSILTQMSCAFSMMCMWQNNECIPFTSCSALYGQTQSECFYQSYFCPATDGTYCGSFNELKSCSDILIRDDCNGYVSQTGICFWIRGTCVLTQNCNNLDNSECSNLEKACSWQNSACVANQCSNYATESTCTYVQVSTQQLQCQLCQWDNATNVCSAATSMSSLTSSNCLTSTMYSYRWVPSGTSGSCESCFGFLYNLILVGVLIIFI